MILADSAILQEIQNGNIVLTPYDLACVGSNSYDVHLSPKLAVYRAVCFVHGGEPRLWMPDENWIKNKDLVLDSKKDNEILNFEIPPEGIVLKPGILYLGSTIEYTETRGLVPYLEGKSSMGRLGIKVHVTAGKGDIGFVGHWTLEIEVTHPIRIYPGMKIAQITYFRPEGFCVNPYNKKAGAKYNTRLGDDRPVASRNNLNFEGGGANAHWERWGDSGISGLPTKDEEESFSGDTNV